MSLFLVATLCLLPTPIGVAVGDEGTVFVADATLNRVFGPEAQGRRK